MSTTTYPTSRDGRFRALSREWDHNGGALVEVVDTRPGDIRSELLTPSARRARAARDVARRTDPMGDAKWTRLEKIFHSPSAGGIVYRFTVSRLDPQYR